jgi:ribonuclease HII
MVYGICFCPASKKDALKALGFADSKTLTAAQRTALFEKLKACGFVGHLVDALSPELLSARMLRHTRVSLNALSHDSAIGLIQRVMDRGVRIGSIFVDTVGPPEQYAEKLRRIFDSVPAANIVVSAKADSLYPIVSAASIVAKVTRDTLLEHWKFKEADPQPPLTPAPAPTSTPTSAKKNGAAADADGDVAMTAASAVGNGGSSSSGGGSASASAAASALPKPKGTEVGASALGSGYPGDPTTKQWLSDAFDPVFGWPSLVVRQPSHCSAAHSTPLFTAGNAD